MVAAEVRLIPIIAEAGDVTVAAVARRSPIRLLFRFTVGPAEIATPLITVPALLPEISYILFLAILAVVALPE